MDAATVKVGKHSGEDSPKNKKLDQKIYRDHKYSNSSSGFKSRTDDVFGQVPSQSFRACRDSDLTLDTFQLNQIPWCLCLTISNLSYLEGYQIVDSCLNQIISMN